MTAEAAAALLPVLLEAAFGAAWSDPATQDIFVNDAGRYWVRGTGEARAVAAGEALAARDVRAIATLAAHLRGQRFDAGVPLLDCELPGGERLAAVMAPCVPQACPVLAIRRGSREVPTIEGLEAQGLFRDALRGSCRRDAQREHARRLRDRGDIADLWRLAVAGGWNMAFVGETGSGKSHDMMACVMEVPRGRRLVFAGDIDEVPKGLPHPNRVTLVAAKHGAVGQGKLIAQSLRMRPDWLFVPEIRDGDGGWALYRALNSGHRGITSWHAGSARKAFAAASGMMLEHDAAQAMSDGDLRARLATLVDVVSHVRQTPEGGFRVTEVLFGEEVEP